MEMIMVVIFLVSLLPSLTAGQVSCPNGVYVGNSVSTVAVPIQYPHGKGQSVVVYDRSFTIPCTCGLVTGWQLLRYDNSTDGCTRYNCNIDFLVFRNITLTSALTASVVGVYSTNINGLPTAAPPARQPYITIQMPQSEWIPVKFNDTIGWNGAVSSVMYYEEACWPVCPSGLPSTNMYLYGQPKTSITTGTTLTFTNGPAYSYPYYRYYGFRAIVLQGSRPALSNLPQTISIVDSTPVGTVVYTAGATDADKKQTLSFSILRSCPQTSFFTIDSITGAVVVGGNLVGSQSVHTLTIEVSDQCLTASSDLTINIIGMTDVMTTPQLSPGDLLKTGPGYALIVSTALSCLAAIGTSVGLFFCCSHLSNLTKQLEGVKGIKPEIKGKPKDARFLYNGPKDSPLKGRNRSSPESSKQSSSNSPKVPRVVSPTNVRIEPSAPHERS